MVDRESVGAEGLNRRSLACIEAPPPAPMPPPGRYEPPSYESVVGTRVGKEDVKSRLSLSRPVAGSAAMAKEDARSRLSVSRSAAKEDVQNRLSVSRSVSKSAVGPAVEDTHSERPRSAKPRADKSKSAAPSRVSRNEQHGMPLLTLLPLPDQHTVEGLEDSRTVVPSDSVSCVGSRSRRPRAQNSSSSKRKSKVKSEKYARLDRISEARSESTMTPRKYYGSRYNLPVRERDGEVLRRSVVSYTG